MPIDENTQADPHGDAINAQAADDQENQQEIYLEDSEIQEDVAPEGEEEGPEPQDDDDDDMEGGEYDEEGKIEVDMRNNAAGYFDTHEDSVFLVAPHPKLPIVVSGGGDNLGYIWTTNSYPPKLVTKLEGHKESVISGGFTSDGAYLVTGDMAGVVKAWKAENRGQRWVELACVEEVEEVVWVAVHPKQNIVAFGAIDGSVWVYTLEDSGMAPIGVLNGHSAPCTIGAWANVDDMDSLTLVTGSEDGTIVSWNVYGAVANFTLSPGNLRGMDLWVSLSPDPTGKTIAAGSAAGRLALIKLENGQVLDIIDTCSNGRFADGERSVESMAWCESMKLLACGTTSGEVKLFDTATWRMRKVVRLGDAVTKVQFLGDTTVLVAAGMDGVVRKFDARNGDEIWVGRGHNMGVLDFCVSNGKLVTAGDEGVSLIFDETSESMP